MEEVSLFRGIINSFPIVSQEVAHHLLHGGGEVEVDYNKVFPAIWETIENEAIVKQREFEYKNWKKQIMYMLERLDWQKAVFLFNHFGVTSSPPKRFMHLTKNNLSSRLDNDYRKEFMISPDNAFFRILVVDDFFVIHLADIFAPIERMLSDNREETVPIVHFEFECLPERAKERINKEKYDLILLDIDFGNMDLLKGERETGSQALGIIDTAKQKEIPVVMFSKFRTAEKYKKFVSNVIGLITKQELKGRGELWKNLFIQVFKILKEYYDIEIFVQRKRREKNWLIMKSSKLKRVGGYATYLDPKLIEEMVGDIKTTPIFMKDLRIFQGKKEVYRDYMLVPLVDKGRRLVFKFFGRVPEFIGKKSKYLKPIIERLDIYGVEHNGMMPQIKEIKGKAKYEILTINTKEKIEGGSFLYDKEHFFIKLERDLEYVVVPSFSELSLFDIMGPVMIGPSSSHTAGANKIARLARNFAQVFPDIKAVSVQMHDSFRTTGEGHGSHKAIVAGLCGLDQKNKQLPESIETLKNAHWKISLPDRNLYFCGFWGRDIPEGEHHPNTIKFHFYPGISETYSKEINKKTRDEKGVTIPEANFSITGRSWGGGNVQISSVTISGETISFSEEELDENKIRWSGKFPIYIILNSNMNEETVKKNIKTILEESYAGLPVEQFESDIAKTFHFKPALNFVIFQWDQKYDELLKKFEDRLKFGFFKIEPIIPEDDKLDRLLNKRGNTSAP